MIVAFAALLLMILMPPGPRIDVPLARSSETIRWVLAVIGTTFGISSIVVRERFSVLSVLPALTCLFHLIWVLSLL